MLCLLGTYILTKFKDSINKNTLTHNLIEKESNNIDSIRGSKKWILFLFLIAFLHVLNFIFCGKFIYINVNNLLILTEMDGFTNEIKLFWFSLFITFIGCMLTLLLLFYEYKAIKLYKQYQNILRNYDNTSTLKDTKAIDGETSIQSSTKIDV